LYVTYHDRKLKKVKRKKVLGRDARFRFSELARSERWASHGSLAGAPPLKDGAYSGREEGVASGARLFIPKGC